MCGIIACIGVDDAGCRVVSGLENLEYRGYDSAGVAAQSDDGLVVRKQSGQISDLKESFVDEIPSGTLSIGHTRWSTHGPPTDENAHPHTSTSGRVAVVHNGIISNYQKLRERCNRLGYEFESDTDTEVIPHLIEHRLSGGMDAERAIKDTIAELEGSYAITVAIEGYDELFAARKGSPLVIGVGEDANYLASDVPAFLEFTDRVVYLEDGDVVSVSATEHTFLDTGGDSASRPVETVDWSSEDTGKGEYDHYMLKEIDNQPSSLASTIDGRIDTDSDSIEFESFPEGEFTDVDRIHLVACGTSYHAALYGGRLLNRAGIPTQAFRASEYDETYPISSDTLVVGVTQSGETADTLAALRTAKREGAETFAVTNVVGSTAAREADTAVYIRAGPEIGVAATKTFSSQVVTLALLTEMFAAEIPDATPRDDLPEFLDALSELPSQIDEILRTSHVDDICSRYLNREKYLFIGHSHEHPVALEGALKFKEITYKHAEGYASGQLKHGPLALVTPGVPVFTILGADDEKTRINAEEAHARGADVVAVTCESDVNPKFADSVLEIPETHPDLIGLLANVQLQLVAYHTARLLDRSIDKPRNLAKSVTVE